MRWEKKVKTLRLIIISLLIMTGEGLQNGSKRSVVPVYSIEDIREQYCINDKELQVLDNKKKKGILGCFSDNGNSGMSPCSKHAKRCEMKYFDV